MPKKIIYKTGQLVNGFFYFGDTPDSTPKKRKATFKCFCGNLFVTRIDAIKNNKTKSCGCLHTKHGLSRRGKTHRIYRIYHNMINRCYREEDKSFKNYGERGISVCEEWINNPKSFFKWALQNGYGKNLQIDRINNNGNYEPSNCRFVTPAINGRNRRTTKLSYESVNHIRTIGNKISQRKLAKIYGTTQYAIFAVLNNKSWCNYED